MTEIVEILRKKLRRCDLCPRRCLVDRTKTSGFCGIKDKPMVSTYFPHFGEESVITGIYGSGTIFFTGCNLKCVFCQNYEISHLMRGTTITVRRLAEIMLELQEMHCHNINLVTPTHQVPFIVEALALLGDRLHIPIVYNTSAYDSPAVVKLLDGIVDIYMPDFKFYSAEAAKRYMNAPDYPKVAKAVIKEMYRQVGELRVEDGIAKKGLLIRHLVMPSYAEDSKHILDWIADNVPKAGINIMLQYRPYYKAFLYPEIARPINPEEYYEVLDYAKALGLRLVD